MNFAGELILADLTAPRSRRELARLCGLRTHE